MMSLARKRQGIQMKHFKKWLSKNYTWMILNLPALIMFVFLEIHPPFWKEITFFSGYFALAFLVVVLSLNPLQTLFPTSVFIKQVNKYRRQIGVAVFSYAVIHFLCFLTKREFDIGATLKYFFHPALIPAVIALVIFGLLALTSNNYAVKKLGFVKWKKLHKFVYIAEALIFIHMFILGARLYAFLIFVPLVMLQILRKIKKKKTEVPY